MNNSSRRIDNAYINEPNSQIFLAPDSFVPPDSTAWSPNITQGNSESVSLVFTDLNNTGNVNWQVPATAASIDVVSDSADDTLFGSGVQILVLIGVDLNFDSITEAILMNGTTPVTSNNTWKNINRMLVFQMGTGLLAAGNITATNTNDTTVWNKIILGESSEFCGRFTVPNGQHVDIKNVGWSSPAAGDFVLNLDTDLSKNSITTTSKIYVHESAGKVDGAPFKLDEQKTLKLRAKRQAGGGGAATLMAFVAGFNVDNNYSKGVLFKDWV